jgi:hypothetical protein
VKSPFAIGNGWNVMNQFNLICYYEVEIDNEEVLLCIWNRNNSIKKSIISSFCKELKGFEI